MHQHETLPLEKSHSIYHNNICYDVLDEELRPTTQTVSFFYVCGFRSCRKMLPCRWEGIIQYH